MAPNAGNDEEHKTTAGQVTCRKRKREREVERERGERGGEREKKSRGVRRLGAHIVQRRQCEYRQLY
jgi:hypothetical protein